VMPSSSAMSCNGTLGLFFFVPAAWRFSFLRNPPSSLPLILAASIALFRAVRYFVNVESPNLALPTKVEVAKLEGFGGSVIFS